MDIAEAQSTLNEAISKNFGHIEAEYRYIKPIIFCEEYIDEGLGDLPIDYKFHCFNGEIECKLVVSERKKGSYKTEVYNEK